ncbi:hypothetical protein DFR70_103387 [Nocardia tenerifensis]|uniref:Uncharacterized protein n=1 Tax=Nocardia tenerifensis TaxID=228006 RepID=A0A318K824_9NOCA|nr:hypothetical protein DFR70_103387 [Nocardia tenerifensis]
MTQINVLDLQKMTEDPGYPGEYQTAWSGVSWSKCKGPSVLSHNNCGWD